MGRPTTSGSRWVGAEVDPHGGIVAEPKIHTSLGTADPRRCVGWRTSYASNMPRLAGTGVDRIQTLLRILIYVYIDVSTGIRNEVCIPKDEFYCLVNGIFCYHQASWTIMKCHVSRSFQPYQPVVVAYCSLRLPTILVYYWSVSDHEQHHRVSGPRWLS